MPPVVLVTLAFCGADGGEPGTVVGAVVVVVAAEWLSYFGSAEPASQRLEFERYLQSGLEFLDGQTAHSGQGCARAFTAEQTGRLFAEVLLETGQA